MFDALHKWLGIPPAEQPPNDYRLLGITPFESDTEVIDGAADKQLAFLHGLANGEHAELAEELSNQVSRARLRLLSAEKKAAYDQTLRQSESPASSDLVSSDPVSSDPVSNGTVPSVVAPSVVAPAVVAPEVVTPEAARSPQPVATAPKKSGTVPEAVASSAKAVSPTRSSSSRKRGFPTWVFTILPGSVVLLGLIGLVAAGKLRLDRGKMEGIGVPSDLASRLAGDETRRTNEPADPDTGGSGTGGSGTGNSGTGSNDSGSNSTLESASGESDQNSGEAKQSPGVATKENLDNVNPNVRQQSDSAGDVSDNGVAEVDAEVQPGKEAAMVTDPAGPSPFGPPVNTAGEGEHEDEALASTKLPGAEEIDARMELVRELFQETYQSASTSQERIAVAQSMCDVAAETDDDPAGKLALLQVARGILIGEGEFEKALETVDQAVEHFGEIDSLSLKQAAFLNASNLTGPRASRYSSIMVSLIQESLENGRVEIGASLCSGLRRVLPGKLSSANEKLLKVMENELRDAKEILKTYQSIGVVEITAEESSEATAAGKWYCYLQNRWQEGLKFMAKSTDPQLRTAARLEIKYEAGAGDRNDVAEAWYAAANAAKGPLQRRKLFDQAYEWYAKAAPESQGLRAIRIQRRMEEIDEFTSRSRPKPTTAVRSVSTKAFTGPPKLIRSEHWASSLSARNYSSVKDNVISVGMGDSQDGLGEACAGLEFYGVSTVRVVGGASAGNFPTVDRWTKTGFIVDYRTSAGYSKRVFLSCGTHTGREFTLTPAWGCAKVPHEKIFVGRRNAYEFDLRRYAPADWDGTCWFSLYMQNAGRNRNLKATIVWK